MMPGLQRLASENLWLFLLAVFLFRFSFTAYSGFDLVGDESYYWDWSRHPDWCYFSKPPMVAWIIGAATWLFGDYTAVVRLPSAVLGTLFLLVLYHTTKLFYSSRAAFLALIIILATPGNAIGNLIMTIDPPLYFFWIAALYFLYQALFEGRKIAWLLAGIATALAFLSKPSALALPVMTGLYLLITPNKRSQLMNNYLLFLLPIALSAVPLVVWNQQHDWIMLNHSQGHFAEKHRDWLKVLEDFGLFVLIQFLVLSPVIFILLMRVCTSGLTGFRTLPDKERFLFMTGPALLIGIFCLSLVQKVQGNWPGPFYFSALIMLSGWISEGRWRTWLKPALITGFALVALTYSFPFSIRLMGIENTRLDPTYRLKKWNKLASDFNEIRQQVLETPEEAFILVHGHRHYVSGLAFYLPDHPQVYRVEESSRVESQYDIWPGAEQFIGGDGFILSKFPPEHIPVRFRDLFESFQPVGTIVTLPGSKRERRHYVYLGGVLKRWPPA